MSSGLMRFKSLSGIPSTTISGLVPPPNEFNPLINKLAPSAPGSPERLLVINPGTRPAKELETEGEAF
ncbi:hypothetical protein D3C85_1028830 [compost metagenome]